MKSTPFEHKACGRCGGTGRYSFNLTHGSTCYGCGGKGYKLTSAGRAASARFTALMSVPAAELVPGTRVRLDTVTASAQPCSCWYTFEKYEGGFLHARNSEGPYTCDMAPATLVRVQQTAEEKAAKLAQSLTD